MLKKLFFTVILFLFFFESALVYCADKGEFQYWLNTSVSKNINKDLILSLSEEFRFGNDAKDFYQQYSDLGLSYTGIADWLVVGINYRHIFEESDGHWYVENRPHFNLTLKYKGQDWGLSTRSRFEYRNRQEKEDFWRYRNKFTLTLPFFATSIKLKPYIADEIYYDFGVSAINRNRLYAGFTFNPVKNFKADIYYLWQNSERSGDWSDINVLGTKFTLSF